MWQKAIPERQTSGSTTGKSLRCGERQIRPIRATSAQGHTRHFRPTSAVSDLHLFATVEPTWWDAEKCHVSWRSGRERVLMDLANAGSGFDTFSGLHMVHTVPVH